jgi:hypothetical protein
MPSHRTADPAPQRLGNAGGVRPFRERALLILWPAFVMAGVLDALVFVVIDPNALHWFGSDPLGVSASAVYSIAFLVFWSVISTAGAITHLLEGPGPGPHR